MKISSEEHLHGILTQKGSALNKIFVAYEAHQNNEKAFKKDLPEKYQGQLKLLLYKAGVMSLGVSNSALFSRISYTKDDLLAHFRQKPFWLSLREIKIKMVV